MPRCTCGATWKSGGRESEQGRETSPWRYAAETSCVSCLRYILLTIIVLRVRHTKGERREEGLRQAVVESERQLEARGS